MTLTALFFYLFATLTVASALMVITARNPVHAVLYLILVFFNAAGLFVLLGAEFLAMLLVVVYVGAVLVLFLFVVMMLDVDFAELRAGFIKNAPLGLLVGLIVLAELVMVMTAQLWQPGVVGSGIARSAPIPAGVSNTMALGQLIYTKYVYFFQTAGLVLLVAMIGAIVLTLRQRAYVRRQDIGVQNSRDKASAMDIVKVPAGGYTIPEKATAKGQG
ncbi:MAG TPA: NADH-quinone oxidoreductase subunit J [Hyphomicrobiaceae bacterium]|mgnify:CR=1 FL=1|nr:NADH-quinone oxidoreductase subunit J [Hyphomicrobiaceae bacterium]